MTISSRISVIEAMRGFAAIAVALFHLSGPFGSAIPLLLHSYGWLGVDVFFVISGFVIPLSLHGRGYSLRDFPNFMLRRLVRLEPPYLASIVLMLALWHVSSLLPGFLGDAPSYSFGQLASHLLYAIPLTDYAWLSPVYWSLAYEFVFYVVVGLTFASLIHREIEVTIVAIALVAAVVFYIRSKFDVRILEFAVGILVMRLVVSAENRWRIAAWLCACLGLVVCTGGYVIGAAVALAAGAILFLRHVACGPWAYFLGSISYSLYLTHVPVGGRVINIGKRFGEGPLFEIVLVTSALCASILFAMLFVRLIEAPATSVSRRLGTRRPRVPTGVSSHVA